MKMRIKVKDGDLDATASLNDSRTARKVADALPYEGVAIPWGREVYFEIPVQMEPEQPQASVPPGTIAYWPPGHAFCIFFGEEPYSPVNVIGKLDGDPNLFTTVNRGDHIQLAMESNEG